MKQLIGNGRFPSLSHWGAFTAVVEGGDGNRGGGIAGLDNGCISRILGGRTIPEGPRFICISKGRRGGKGGLIGRALHRALLDLPHDDVYRETAEPQQYRRRDRGHDPGDAALIGTQPR